MSGVAVPGASGPDGPWLVPYRLSMEMKGTEATALRFLRRIEDSNPCVQFHHFSIIAIRPDEPPLLFATIEWPMWAGQEKAAQIQAWREQAAP